MHKITKDLLPNSLLQTNPTNTPVAGSTHDTCSTWLQTYVINTFSNRLFYSDISNELSVGNSIVISNFKTLGIYQNIIKAHLAKIHEMGETEIWTVTILKYILI